MFSTDLVNTAQRVFCHGSLNNWIKGEIASAEHRRYFPGCSFVMGEDVRILASIKDSQSELLPCTILLTRRLLSTVKRRKLFWFRHVCRHDTLLKIILQDSVDGRRRRGRSRKSWKDNIKEWTGQSMSRLLGVAEDRRRWAAITAEASVRVPQRRLGITGFDSLID